MNTPQPLTVERSPLVNAAMKELVDSRAQGTYSLLKDDQLDALLQHIAKLERAAMQPRDARALEVVEKLLAVAEVYQETLQTGHMLEEHNRKVTLNTVNPIIATARQYINEMKG